IIIIDKIEANRYIFLINILEYFKRIKIRNIAIKISNALVISVVLYKLPRPVPLNKFIIQRNVVKNINKNEFMISPKIDY
ncbi:MAG TPA: hypothetical protein H9980_10485, partial [Candidatus Erysipelatoclostridium merdavium]|nr:hypothetical protein [Candidatus Erysipelatoclostridium merdavium]